MNSCSVTLYEHNIIISYDAAQTLNFLGTRLHDEACIIGPQGADVGGGCLTDNKGLFEGGPGHVVPGGSAGGVDGPFVGPQQRRLRLRLARGPFWRG